MYKKIIRYIDLIRGKYNFILMKKKNKFAFPMGKSKRYVHSELLIYKISNDILFIYINDFRILEYKRSWIGNKNIIIALRLII